MARFGPARRRASARHVRFGEKTAHDSSRDRSTPILEGHRIAIFDNSLGAVIAFSERWRDDVVLDPVGLVHPRSE